MTYEEYGVWLERHVAECPDGEGRSMLKMCLHNFKDAMPLHISTHGLIAELERRKPCKKCASVDCINCLWSYITCAALQENKDNFKEAA